MDQTLFQKFRKAADDAGIPANTRKSRDWFRENIKKITKGMSPNMILSDDPSQLRSQPGIGKMYLFFYDPKTKEKLPYYDRFPCTVIVNLYEDGFSGLNFHYLNPRMRAILLSKLLEIASSTRFNERTKLLLTYELLKNSAKFNRYIAPCYKRYLRTHLRSKMLLVPAPEWEMAIQLPFERFEKKSKEAVWRESSKQFFNQGKKK